MLSFLTDENFDSRILDGLLLRKPDIGVVRAQDVGLERQEDPIVLDWAAERGRILLTHDVSTMTAFAYDRVRRGRRDCFFLLFQKVVKSFDADKKRRD